MKKSELMKTIKTSLKKTGFKLKKHSPEILIAAGVVGTIASAVMACKATLKVNDILEGAKEDVAKIKDVRNQVIEADELGESRIDYTDQDYKKDITIVYVQTGFKLAKLYAPSVALGTLSILGMVASNNILRQRNIALAAAYATVEKGFKEYRNRVVERFGDEVDRELRYNVKAQKVDAVTTDENGKEKKVKETINVFDGNPSDYSFYFDESNPYWEKDGNYNRMFLLAQQQFANDKLRADGFLFLNDVLESIGIEKTKAGQMVGWVFNEDRPNGDNYIDFGIYETYKTDKEEFDKDVAIRGRMGKEIYDRVVCLDFNVDGNIWDLM